MTIRIPSEAAADITKAVNEAYTAEGGEAIMDDDNDRDRAGWDRMLSDAILKIKVAKSPSQMQAAIEELGQLTLRYLHAFELTMAGFEIIQEFGGQLTVTDISAGAHSNRSSAIHNELEAEADRLGGRSRDD